MLPPLDRRLAVVVSADYTQPTTTGTESDPRVMGGRYTWKLTEQELGIMAVLMYRLHSLKPVAPYVGIGPRMLLLKSTVEDDGTPMISATTAITGTANTSMYCDRVNSPGTPTRRGRWAFRRSWSGLQ